MAKKDQLRQLRSGTVINVSSLKQESEVAQALVRVVVHLRNKFGGIALSHQRQWLLQDIVETLRNAYPEVEFHYHFKTSAIRPDGGILFLEGRGDEPRVHPILIAEVKNQGTNDQRQQ